MFCTVTAIRLCADGLKAHNNIALTVESRAVLGFQSDDGVRVIHQVGRLPASGDRVLPVLQYDAFGTTLGHARDPRTWPAHEHHVVVHLIRHRRVVPGLGTPTAEAAAVLVRVVVVVTAAICVGAVTIVQRHAIDAILGRGERQQLAFVGRVRLAVLSEHDQPPVVQHRHVIVDEARLPVVLVAREPAVFVERPAARLERDRLVRGQQEVQVVRYPPAGNVLQLQLKLGN